MAQRFRYLLPAKIPQLTDGALEGLKPDLQRYLRDLSSGLHAWDKVDRQAIRELDYHPMLKVVLITANQSLTANVAATVAFNSVVVDTHSWWSSSTHSYTPKEPGFYRCSWGIRIGDGAPIAVSTLAIIKLELGSSVEEHSTLYQGNGTQLNIHASGSAAVECDGSASTISVTALLSSGTTPAVVAGSAGTPNTYPTWLSIDYIGRRFVAT